jgi:hypothetical protein
MSTYEPLWEISLQDGEKLFSITSMGIQLREGDSFSYEGVFYKVESVSLELSKGTADNGGVTFWNTPKMVVVASVIP